jgi:hypothetical protein
VMTLYAPNTDLKLNNYTEYDAKPSAGLTSGFCVGGFIVQYFAILIYCLCFILSGLGFFVFVFYFSYLYFILIFSTG